MREKNKSAFPLKRLLNDMKIRSRIMLYSGIVY